MNTSTYESWDVKVEDGPKPERTLVLLGKTGNGKSATGNSILGERKFKSNSGAEYVTKECQLEKAELPNGVKVNIIDTPGLFSASMTTEFTTREIIKCLRLAPNGFDAVLLVFSAGNRLTKEEQSTLQTLKTLFGNKIVNHMIVVFTNGDQLDIDGVTLDGYLEGSRELKEILDECSDRKVLFDNRLDIPQSKKDEQVQHLLNLVEEISMINSGTPFMSDLSIELMANDATWEERQKLIQSMKDVSTKQEISKLKKEVEKGYKDTLQGIEERISNKLQEPLRDLKEHLAKAQEERAEARKKMTEIRKLSSDEISRLREQLTKAQRETDSLRKELKDKCSIL